MSELLHELIRTAAERDPRAAALTFNGRSLSYEELLLQVERVAAGLLALGIGRGERVAIYLDKRFETVVGAFAAARAGAAFVPVNPLLKAEQVGYILRDCNVRILVTSSERLDAVGSALSECPDLRHVVVVGHNVSTTTGKIHVPWSEVADGSPSNAHRVIDTDLVSILYTSGSTGKPKGVMLSHRNMVAGARSVASYLFNRPDDTILAALPLSFDAGFSQLTTAFHAGARVVLLNFLLPRDVLDSLRAERVTGLTAVPPLWIQLSQLDWPAEASQALRYIANTGGRMPRETLARLRERLPHVETYLMYGLTEAFRSTFLSPSEVDRRPDSIGKAIPNAEILVLRPDGSPCGPNEPGELVHRGALVAMGYWNDPEKTAQRYKPLPNGVGGREPGMVLPEIAVFSGDLVRADEDGYLYFIGRNDEMIKTSGYRVSPTEIEEVVYGTKLAAEAAAFGVAHATLGQSIVVVATPANGIALESEALLMACRRRLPAYMIPSAIEIRDGTLPRNPNGKIDRKALASEYAQRMRADT